MSAAEWSDGAAGPVLNLFDELTEPGWNWQDRALCAQTWPDAFFPEKGKPCRDAKAICARCEVREPCLEYVLEIESRPGAVGRHGIWAATTPRERQDIARARRQEREAAA